MYPDGDMALKQERVNFDNAKMAADARGMCGTAQTIGRTPYTLGEEAGKRAQQLQIEAHRAQQAANFFAKNPSFDEFVRLIREGTIRI